MDNENLPLLDAMYPCIEILNDQGVMVAYAPCIEGAVDEHECYYFNLLEPVELSPGKYHVYVYYDNLLWYIAPVRCSIINTLYGFKMMNTPYDDNPMITHGCGVMKLRWDLFAGNLQEMNHWME